MSATVSDAFAVCDGHVISDGVPYAPWSDVVTKGAEHIFVPSLDMPDDMLDALIDRVLTTGARVMVMCSQTLTEVGRIDARFGKSPVMLLHAFGLLPFASVASGVYLDKDDLSLMAQEGVPLIALPSFDAGNGFGVAPVFAAVERGVTVRLGTADGTFNRSRNIIYEASVLRLLTSAQLNRRSAVDVRDLAVMCLTANATAQQIEQTAQQIERL